MSQRSFGVAADLTLLIGAAVALAAVQPDEPKPGACGYAHSQAVSLVQGATVLVSVRLESMRKSLGPRLVAKVAYENVGFGVQHSGQPYVTEACSALQVVKHVPDQELLRTRDARGMKHMFVGAR